MTLAQPELLDAILREVPVADHDMLQQVAKSWYHAINRPQMWHKRHGPGVVCRASRSLYLSFRPGIDAVQGDFPRKNPPMSRVLGTFADAAWRLRTGALPKATALVQHRALLDQATLLRFSPHLVITPTELSLLLAASRGETLSFLLDRAFRIKHNLPSPTYRVDSADAVAALFAVPCLLGAVVFAASTALLVRNFTTSIAAAIVVSAAGLKLFGVGRQLHRDAAADGRAMLHNMRYGHVRSRQLDVWAQQMAAYDNLQDAPIAISESGKRA